MKTNRGNKPSFLDFVLNLGKIALVKVHFVKSLDQIEFDKQIIYCAIYIRKCSHISIS